MSAIAPVEVTKVEGGGSARAKQGGASETGPAVGGRRVVLPVDGSAASEHTLEWAARNILRRGDVAFVVSALPRSKPSALASGTFEEDDISWEEDVRRRKDECEVGIRNGASLVSGAARRLQSAVHAASGSPGSDAIEIRPVVLDACGTIVTPYGGNTPARTIAQYSENENADVIVLGSRGLGGGGKMLLGVLGLGSVSDEVSKRATCPVTIVHPTR